MLVIIGSSFSFFAIQLLLRNNLNLPDKIKTITDNKTRTTQTNEYFGNFSPIFHGLFATIFGICLFYSDSDYFDDHNTFFENKLIGFSIGFFVYDLIFSVYCDYIDNGKIIHHFSALFLLFFSLITGKYGYSVVILLGLGEAAEPITCLEFIYKQNSEREQDSFTLSMAFFLIFFVARGPFLYDFAFELSQMQLGLFIKFVVCFGCKFNRVSVKILLFCVR